LHYIGANGVEGERQKTPANAVEVARILLDAGAEESSTYPNRVRVHDKPVRLAPQLLEHGAYLNLERLDSLQLRLGKLRLEALQDAQQPPALSDQFAITH
jgi:hypothetical protein